MEILTISGIRGIQPGKAGDLPMVFEAPLATFVAGNHAGILKRVNFTGPW